jgi:AraC-like DNA-binding protein
MDSLSLILDDMHFEGVRFAYAINQSPWAWQLATPGVACTHQVVQGEAWLVREDEAPLHLVAGDLVVLPAGTAHRIQDHPRSLAKPRDMLPLMGDNAQATPMPAGAMAGACQLISTHARFDVNMAAPLIRALPPLLHVRGHGASPPPWLDVGMQFLAIQVAMPSPGQQAILNRIGDILFMQVIRDHVASVTEGSGNWLAALKDKALSAALAHIHQDPRHNWTVPELAQKACLSRSAFAERFTQTMGEPPLTYLTRHRMRLAARHLQRSTLPVSKVADLVGYASEAAFSQAFKREFGASPTAWRQQRQAQPAAPAGQGDDSRG